MASNSDLLCMTWPSSGEQHPPEDPFPAGYRSKAFVDRGVFTQVQSAIGWTMRDGQWEELMEGLVPGAMIFAECTATGDLVAVACGTSVDRQTAELGWVAVDPAYRGHGLGRAVCGAVTAWLLGAGYEHIRLSTQRHRLAALHIYISLGYEPVIEPATAEPWRRVYESLGLRPPERL